MKKIALAKSHCLSAVTSLWLATPALAKELGMGFAISTFDDTPRTIQTGHSE
ncbi:hypothetical protein [Marinobacterium rhizophilum]|uniref:hypothetical protein n=1 Tax=Marinobacterium rhizophilum TaxID=420402 RepID=UPI00037F909A|nr:hypothetical protein [Marinobacterium rhizophilum]